MDQVSENTFLVHISRAQMGIVTWERGALSEERVMVDPG